MSVSCVQLRKWVGEEKKRKRKRRDQASRQFKSAESKKYAYVAVTVGAGLVYSMPLPSVSRNHTSASLVPVLLFAPRTVPVAVLTTRTTLATARRYERRDRCFIPTSSVPISSHRRFGGQSAAYLGWTGGNVSVTST